MKIKFWTAVVVFSVLGLWGCSSDDVVTNPPAPLPDFTAEVGLDDVWSERVGDGLGEKFTRIRPAVSGNSIFAASVDGVVVALDRMTGKTQWESNLETAISGGVGVGDDLVFVATLNGELVALNVNDGTMAWSVATPSEVLSVPQYDSGRVVVQSNDDSVAAFNAEDGSMLWVYNDTMPTLSVRGTASPIVYNGAAIAGLASGRIAVIDMQQGFAVWDRPVSLGEGRSELDRLVDVDGSPVLNGSDLFAGNYHGNLLALNVRDGEVKWQQEVSTLESLVVDSTQVYVTNADGHVASFEQSSGSPVWTQTDLSYREITAPALFKNYVAVADLEGYVHLMSTEDGRIIGRARSDSDGVRVQPLVVDDMMYVYGNSGKLIAYQITGK